MTGPIGFSSNQNKRPISIEIPIISENFQRNVRYIKLTAIAVTGVAFAILYYTFIRPSLMSYNGHIAYIQNAMKCMNEPQNSLMPGCKNNVYCMVDDPSYKNNPFYPMEACVNNKTSILFSKKLVEDDVSKYLNSTGYAKQLFDKFYFETVVRLAP